MCFSYIHSNTGAQYNLFPKRRDSKWICNTLEHTALHCDMLRHNTTRSRKDETRNGHWNASRYSERSSHCNALQHTATHCNALQHTLNLQAHRNASWNPERSSQLFTATHCNTLQHTATHCNTLQHIGMQVGILKDHCSSSFSKRLI